MPAGKILCQLLIYTFSLQCLSDINCDSATKRPHAMAKITGILSSADHCDPKNESISPRMSRGIYMYMCIDFELVPSPAVMLLMGFHLILFSKGQTLKSINQKLHKRERPNWNDNQLCMLATYTLTFNVTLCHPNF